MCRHSRALPPDKSDDFSAVESVVGYEYRGCRRELLSNVDHHEVNVERSEWVHEEGMPRT
jgi:hypothetical protein